MRAAFRSHSHAPKNWHKHLVMNSLIDVDGDRAVASSMFARLDPFDDTPQIRNFGRYRDICVRCPDGKWRFSERRVEVEARRAGGLPGVTRADIERLLASDA